MTEYRQTVDFMIDRGELAGESVEQAFALGVEFQICRVAIQECRRGALVLTIHEPNLERLTKLAADHGFHASGAPLGSGGRWMTMRLRRPPHRSRA